MTHAEIFQRYVELCHTTLLEDKRVLDLLMKTGIHVSFIFESFSLGYANGRILDPVGENEEIVQKLRQIAFSEQKEGEIKSNTSDILRACELLGRYKSMFSDKTEHIVKTEPIPASGPDREAWLRDQLALIEAQKGAGLALPCPEQGQE